MTQRKPNIIFIVADDLGYADLGCYGGRAPVSPVLDGLAANGMRFTQGYANAPVCSPTRYALMTGRYQYRLRGAAEEPMSIRTRASTTLGLPAEHPTLPSLLKAGGYRTALIGKWHLGFPPAFGPLRSGYDEFYGPMSGGIDYFTHAASNGAHDLWEGEAPCFDEGYFTDLISRRAVRIGFSNALFPSQSCPTRCEPEAGREIPTRNEPGGGLRLGDGRLSGSGHARGVDHRSDGDRHERGAGTHAGAGAAGGGRYAGIGVLAGRG